MRDFCKEFNQFGKGVSSETRYRILESLFKHPSSVNDLVKRLDITQPAVSQNLKILKDNNLVIDERHGQEVIYSINFDQFLKFIKRLTRQVKKGEKNYA